MELEKFIVDQLNPMATPVLLAVIAISLAGLAKLADLVVDQAIILSDRSGIPKVVVGATIVSLGTTAPEVAVSVLAAFRGNPGLAMGNAVGSIICDTGLILGIACLIRPLTIPTDIANRQGWVQLGAGLLLVVFSIPWATPLAPWTDQSEGVFPQWAGFVFLGLLVVYLYLSVKWSRKATPVTATATNTEPAENAISSAGHLHIPLTAGKLILAIAGVVISASILIPAVTLVAERWGVPESVIALTIVAFGTSLPELVTSVQAARRGHGDLAIGNIIGADVLNALFVAGASAAVSAEGLAVGMPFFWLSFPTMIAVLLVFRVGILVCRDQLTRGFGIVLLGCYLAYLGLTVATGFRH